MKPMFENVAMAKVSTSGEEARSMGYLRPADLIAMNRDRQVADAKTDRAGDDSRRLSSARRRRKFACWARNFWRRAKLAIYMLVRGEFATEYDGVVGRKLAYMLAGGAVTAAQTVSEQYMLDLEREAFVSLCGERKTQERIAHTLKTGKPLRN